MNLLKLTTIDVLNHFNYCNFNNYNKTNKNDGFNFDVIINNSIPAFLDYMLEILTWSQRIGFTIAVIILLIIGLIGNIGTLLVNIQKKRRLLFRLSLISLACSDLLTIIFISTTYLSQFLTSKTPLWYLGEIMCAIIPFITTTAILANSMTLVVIALDRYLAVTKLIKGTWEPGLLFCVSCMVFLWGLAAGISSPMITSYFILDVYVVETNRNDPTEHIGYYMSSMCVSEKAPNALYYGIIFSIIFLPLLIAFIWLNSLIAYEIYRRRHPIGIQSSLNGCGDNSNDNININNNNKQNSGDGDLNSSSIDKKTTEIVNFNEKNINKLHNQRFDMTKTTSLNNQNNDDRSTQSNKNNINNKITDNNSIKTITNNNNSNNINNNNNNFSVNKKSNRKTRQLRMFKIVVFIMMVFFLLRLPTWIYLLIKLNRHLGDNIHWVLHYCFGILSIANCALNPFIYTFLAETLQWRTFIGKHFNKFCFSFKNCIHLGDRNK